MLEGTETTGDVTGERLYFYPRSLVQTLFFSWPLSLPLNLILCESEVTGMPSKAGRMTWAVQTNANPAPALYLLLCSSCSFLALLFSF